MQRYMEKFGEIHFIYPTNVIEYLYLPKLLVVNPGNCGSGSQILGIS
jgi:hypothetical protein